jgi:hypothetical protein
MIDLPALASQSVAKMMNANALKGPYLLDKLG